MRFLESIKRLSKRLYEHRRPFRGEMQQQLVLVSVHEQPLSQA